MTRRSSALLLAIAQAACASLALGAPARAPKAVSIRTADGVTDVSRGATDAPYAVRSLDGELIVSTS
ncbi:MAG TPA: hypothetical protein VGR00_07220, partial [Thermoanaerobaculia bacterium]|nr:hypothetical protein [Thermoanaerobaculia bacterium]